MANDIAQEQQRLYASAPRRYGAACGPPTRSRSTFAALFTRPNDVAAADGYVDGDPARPVRRFTNNYRTYLGPDPYYSHVGVYDEIALESFEQAELTHAAGGSGGRRRPAQRQHHRPRRGVVIRLGRRPRPAAGWPDGSEAPLPRALRSQRPRPLRRRDRPLRSRARCCGGRAATATSRSTRLEAALVAGGVVEQLQRRTLGFRRVSMPQPLHFEVNDVPGEAVGRQLGSPPDWVTEVWNGEKAPPLPRHRRARQLQRLPRLGLPSFRPPTSSTRNATGAVSCSGRTSPGCPSMARR